MRVNRKRVNRGHESIVKKLVVNSNILFKFIKWVGNYVLTMHHLRFKAYLNESTVKIISRERGPVADPIKLFFQIFNVKVGPHFIHHR